MCEWYNGYHRRKWITMNQVQSLSTIKINFCNSATDPEIKSKVGELSRG